MDSKKILSQKNIADHQNDWSENLREIDRQLLDDVNNSKLWLSRAEESRKQQKNLCSLVAELTSCVIQQDEKAIMSVLEAHKNEIYMQEVSELFSSSSCDQQQIWDNIQNGAFCTELKFSLQLYFAQKFNNQQIRKEAIKQFLYQKIKLSFYTFENFAPFEKPINVSNLREENISIVKKKAEDFLSVLDNAKKEQRIVIRKQFALLLENHFGKPILQEKEEFDSSSWLEDWQKILHYLQNYSDIDFDNSDDHFKLWSELLSPLYLKNMGIEKILMREHENFCPIFNFSFKDEAMAEIKEIYMDYVRGGLDWKERFSYKYAVFNNAKNQRKLMYLVTKYGPLPDFEQCIYDFKFGDSHFYTITMNCDIYLLHLIYNKKINEQEFFDEMLGIVPLPNLEYKLIDFCDVMEHIIFCLFLSSHHKREEMFIQAFDKIQKWINFYPQYLAELLKLVAFLQIAIVYDKLPDSVCPYYLQAHKKRLWVDYARYLYQKE